MNGAAGMATMLMVLLWVGPWVKEALAAYERRTDAIKQAALQEPR